MKSVALAFTLAACALTSAASLASFDTPPVSAPAKPTAADAVPKVAALERVAVVGASLSAGFRVDGGRDPFAPSKIQLANVIEASLHARHEPVRNHANPGFFMDPKGSGQAAMEALREEPPTAIVALDYLFWFGYGAKKEEERLPQVEAALKDLGTFTCPILLGDLPDMRSATQVKRPMLRPSMVPTAETLAKLNDAVRTFAKEHKNVIVVPLADVTAKLQSDAEFSVRDNHWAKGSIDALMQADRLHPTLEGTCAVWIVAVDAWTTAQKDVPVKAFECDVPKLVAAVQAAAKKPAEVAPVPAGGSGK